jgi:ABC-type transporter Mla subunit MlaD
MDDLISSLECALDENGLPDAACQAAVALLRKQAARIAELEAASGDLIKWAEPLEERAEKAEARADRLSAMLKEAEEAVRKARLSLSRAARDFHAQQADDLLFYAMTRLEAREVEG